SKRRAGLPDKVDAVVARALAKEPEQRFASCGALVSAAGQALGLGKMGGVSRRRRSFAWAGAIGLAIAVGAVVIATTLLHGSPLCAGPNPLARIDPTTKKVSAVIHVGPHPVVVTAAAHYVWVYNKGDSSISEVDAQTNHVLRTTSISGSTPAECCSLSAGPVGAADASGAWFVNGGEFGKAQLTHIAAADGRKRAHRLDLTPTGVAVGQNAVWVVGHRGRDYRLLRIDPSTGRVTHETKFPLDSQVDSIAYGYHFVWVLSSSTATLYRIDSRSTRHAGNVRIGHSPATRPEIVRFTHDLTVRST